MFLPKTLQPAKSASSNLDGIGTDCLMLITPPRYYGRMTSQAEPDLPSKQPAPAYLATGRRFSEHQSKIPISPKSAMRDC